MGEYLDCKSCNSRKKLVDELVAEFSENIDEKELHPAKLHSNKMISSSIFNDYEKTM